MNDEFPNPGYEETDDLDLDVLATEVLEKFSDDFDERLQPEILKRFDAFVDQLKQVPSIETSIPLEMVLERNLLEIATAVKIEDRQTVLVNTIVQKFEKTLTPEARTQFNRYIDIEIRPEINNGNVIENLEAVLMHKIKKAPGMWRDEKKLLLKQITAIENAFDACLTKGILVSEPDLTDRNRPILKKVSSSQKDYFALTILKTSFKELSKRAESNLLVPFFAREHVGERLNQLDLESLHRKNYELRNQVVEYFDEKFIACFRSHKNNLNTALIDWKENKQDLVGTLCIHFASMVFLHISEQLKTKKITSSGRSKKS